VSVHFVQELPVPKLTAKQRERLAKGAEKLSKKPGDVKERAALEIFIARELYGLDAADWEHLTGTFTFAATVHRRRNSTRSSGCQKPAVSESFLKSPLPGAGGKSAENRRFPVGNRAFTLHGLQIRFSDPAGFPAGVNGKRAGLPDFRQD